MRPPLLYRCYVAATSILVPFASWWTLRKLRRAGVPALRAFEKLGHASEVRRGSGPLIWFHAASVGESLSVLALITRMGQMLPRAQFLITSGTATSAELVARRMPPRCLHQFAPLDAPGPMKRFLKHWRPDAAVFVESEIWPQMLRRTRAHGTPMALVNARISAGSRKAWAKRPVTARYLFDVFDLILTQNETMAETMIALNAPTERVASGFNLKSLSDPLPVDDHTVADMRGTLNGRPVWVAASTHPGEEEIILDVHARLLRKHPDLCLILAPRHPDRSSAVADIITKADLSFTTRSEGDTATAQVFLADTLGELGNWYALAPFVFLGGSLHPIGGHNPFEVAQSGAMVLSGSHVANFAETFDEMAAAGAAIMVADAKALETQIDGLLNDPKRCSAGQQSARRFAESKSDALDNIAERLIHALKLESEAQ